MAATARHYARWVKGAQYREPFRLEAGEVPADYLARLTDGDGSKRTETARVAG